MSTGEFLAAVAGLVVGLLMGLLLGAPLANLPDPYGFLLPLGVSIVFGLGMMGLTVAKRHDLVGALREAGLASRPPAPPVPDAAAVTYLDTSAIIDGRLVDVVAAGFLWGTLVVPRFVLGELGHVADDERPDRRARGRRGLETLAVLQKDHRVSVELSDESLPAGEDGDARIVELARLRGGAVLTTD